MAMRMWRDSLKMRVPLSDRKPQLQVRTGLLRLITGPSIGQVEKLTSADPNYNGCVHSCNRLTAALLWSSVLAFGQKPVFEVASVKVNKSGETAAHGEKSLASGRFEFINTRMSELIMWAYYVRVEYITGPSWLNSDRFDIVAKAPPNTSLSDVRLMLRSLLADRFKLTVTQGEKVIPVFALVVGKRGPVLTPTVNSDQERCAHVPGVEGQIHVDCTNMTLADLAGYLPDLAPRYIDRPVVDLTGIKGFANYALDKPSASPYS
jgi:uncharacterized protein (TIGR03435 family)